MRSAAAGPPPVICVGHGSSCDLERCVVGVFAVGEALPDAASEAMNASAERLDVVKLVQFLYSWSGVWPSHSVGPY